MKLEDARWVIRDDMAPLAGTVTLGYAGTVAKLDDPDAVRVEQVEREDATVLELYVAPEDRGKVIGRQGRLARALRTIVRASAAGSLPPNCKATGCSAGSKSR